MPYDDPDNEDSDSEREAQLQMMRDWFFEHFEDPAERTPYESREGGYIWIWGGPYDAHDELETEFGDSVPEDVIEELAKELTSICWEWAPTPSREDYDDYWLEDDLSSNPYEIFKDSIQETNALLQDYRQPNGDALLNRMVFAQQITALKTYLAGTLINEAITDPKILMRLITQFDELKDIKVSLADIEKHQEGKQTFTQSIVHKELQKIMYHNLKKVNMLYKIAFEFQILDKTEHKEEIFKAVRLRHDCVHRNGYDKDNKKHKVFTVENVQNNANMIEELVDNVEKAVKTRHTSNPSRYTQFTGHNRLTAYVRRP
ncbi:MAG: hypothetical protein FWD67_12730 [Betaproteobacteria bacterium]|nr:hypothetical protein [Betaproteobacteria bacterium]